MPQLSEIRQAVTTAMPSMRGLRSAIFRSPVRRVIQSTSPAMGTDHSTRCAITSDGGICASAFM